MLGSDVGELSAEPPPLVGFRPLLPSAPTGGSLSPSGMEPRLGRRACRAPLELVVPVPWSAPRQPPGGRCGPTSLRGRLAADGPWLFWYQFCGPRPSLPAWALRLAECSCDRLASCIGLGGESSPAGTPMPRRSYGATLLGIWLLGMYGPGFSSSFSSGRSHAMQRYPNSGLDDSMAWSPSGTRAVPPHPPPPPAAPRSASDFFSPAMSLPSFMIILS
mmetsp:Transcript_23194/g.60350  ORF Transcript_23194/g.60350 Transcript_23194/m.60350 type:complete len:218 (+) Transcript_23194:134-787(+)